MPSLADHQSSSFVKLLYIGDSGTGKTGSLASLVMAGYNLCILDMDNGLDALAQFIRKEDPSALARVKFATRRDTYKASPAGPYCPRPTAFVEALKLMTKWEDDTIPAELGPDWVFVIDSGSALGKAAFEWAKGLNPTAKDPRQWYFAAQQAIENVVANLTGDEFKANVILISHVNYKEMIDGSTKGYANTIGTALGPVVAKYFNNLILAESVGSGTNVKRRIKTLPTGVIDLKTSAPFKIDGELPLASGLATIFAKIKETN